MKLYCRHCKKIIIRDMRLNAHKSQMTKRGYRSYCETTGKTTYLIPTNKI